MMLRKRVLGFLSCCVATLVLAGPKSESLDTVQNSLKMIGDDLKKITKTMSDSDKEILYGVLDKIGSVQRAYLELKGKYEALKDGLSSKKDKDGDKESSKNDGKGVLDDQNILKTSVAAAVVKLVSGDKDVGSKVEPKSAQALDTNVAALAPTLPSPAVVSVPDASQQSVKPAAPVVSASSGSDANILAPKPQEAPSVPVLTTAPSAAPAPTLTVSPANSSALPALPSLPTDVPAAPAIAPVSTPTPVPASIVPVVSLPSLSSSSSALPSLPAFNASPAPTPVPQPASSSLSSGSGSGSSAAPATSLPSLPPLPELPPLPPLPPL